MVTHEGRHDVREKTALQLSFAEISILPIGMSLPEH
jgi:hypothetical protein